MLCDVNFKNMQSFQTTDMQKVSALFENFSNLCKRQQRLGFIIDFMCYEKLLC